MLFRSDQIQTLILEYYEHTPKPTHLMVPESLNASLLSEALGIKVSSPKRGDKVKELNLAHDNATQALVYHLNRVKKKGIDIEDALDSLAMHLHVDTIRSIEMVDVSHTFGTLSVGARIVFENGQFNKTKYRRYKLQGKNNDLENMREMLYRRLYKALDGSEPLPDLMLVDGGIHQVNVLNTLLKDMSLSVAVAGLVKDHKHQTSELMRSNGEKVPLLALDPLTLLCVQLQDEVHRFAISFHQKLRSQAQVHSSLKDIAGLGDKRIQTLMKKFKNISNIKSASVEDLSSVVPLSVAENIASYFKGESDE